MVGYQKGTSVAREMQAIREAVARIGAAMQSDPDAGQALLDATALERLGSEISGEASIFRAWFAAYLCDVRKMPPAQIARLLGVSARSGRVTRLISAGRKQRGNPVMDPGTMPEPAPVAVAIVTSEKGVLVAHRKDERPPWTFPGGELDQGESPADALRRRVTAETGLGIITGIVFGRRVHPRTNRVMIYMACQASDENARPAIRPDDEDLDEVKWAGLDEVRQLMPDMYEPVRAHLEATLAPMGQF